MAEIERRARRIGLPALRWPDPWPSNYLTAMRAATAAFGLGEGRAFVREAFRSAFHGDDRLEDAAAHLRSVLARVK